MSGRNAPEWFGGGSGGGLSSMADTDISNNNSRKKKHRRSKSDTSYQKSSSRKAAERKRRSSKEHSNSSSHRRGRSRAAEDSLDISSNTIFSTGTEAEAFSQFLQQGVAMNMNTNMSEDSGYANENANLQAPARENSNRTIRRKNSRHGRSFSMPSPAAEKKSLGFLERWLGFGRSDNKPQPELQQEPALISQPPVHLHMNIHNKMEEKYDPEELRPLAPPPSSSPASSFHPYLSSSVHTDIISNGIHDVHRNGDSGGLNNNNVIHNSIFNDERQYLQQQQQQQQQQRKQQLPFTYQKPAATATLDHGTESDDLLTYSDDDTASYIPQMPSYPMQQNQSAASLLYPSYLSSEDMQNHEAYQVMQQQRMMALSNNNNNNSNHNHQSNPMSRYGATDLLPPLNQQEHLEIRRPQQQRFYRNPNNNSNDMYISEDETMSSYHTQETYRNVDNFYFKRIKNSHSHLANNALTMDSGESSSDDQKLLLTSTQEEMVSDLLTEENKSNLSEGGDVLEVDPMLDETFHQHNRSFEALDKAEKRDIFRISGDGSGSSASGNSGGGGSQNFDATTSAMMEQLSNRGSRGSSNFGGDDNNSSSSSSSQLITPPGRSNSSGSGSGTRSINKVSVLPLHLSDQQQPQRQPIHPKPSSPPPPISSVQIIRNSGTTTTMATTGSNSSSSPHTNVTKLRQSSSSSLKQSMQQPRLSRKEIKRLRKRIELAEGREDYVQFLLRDGHRDMDWSEHVPQNVGGMNRAAGFFPEENSKPRDLVFAILFLGQLSTVIFLASRYARGTILHSDGSQPVETNPYMVDNDDPFSSGSPLPDENSSPISIWAKDVYVDYANAVQLSCITGLYATVLSALAIGMMMILSSAFIPTVLCMTVVICVAFGTIMMALSPYTVLPVLGLAALAISLAYSIVVWDRIPFATTNLNTALAGIKSSADILLIGFAMMVVAFLWTITWMIAFLGIYDHYLDNAEHELSKNITWVGLSVSLGMFISYFWTFYVIMNIVHVTVAGVVGTWWASPDSLTSCCTNVFREHFITSITKSFGSVCLGSLVVPPLGLLQFFLLFLCPPQTSTKPHALSIPVSDHSSHAHDVGSMMGDKSVKSELSSTSFYPQMSSPLDGITRYFNDFGFTYVGIYRQGFIASSEKATDIFKAREWSGIVADRLIPYILKIICLLITLGSGFFGLVVEEYDGYSYTNFRKPTSTAFIIGCFVGMVLSSVCLKVVESSVSTVLVCFSVAPYAFKHFHPILSDEMRASWGGMWLDEISPVY